MGVDAMSIFEQVRTAMQPSQPALEAFRAFVAPYFVLRKADAVERAEAFLAGDTMLEYRRRPVIAVRLFDKQGDIVVRPKWMPVKKNGYSQGGTLDTETITVELLRRGTFSRLDLEIDAIQTVIRRCHSKMEVNLDNVKFVSDTLSSFLDSPVDYFHRGDHSHCCCCGKELTDEISVSRGIGPECVKRFGYFLDRKA
jgi:hypothetical protein